MFHLSLQLLFQILKKKTTGRFSCKEFLKTVRLNEIEMAQKLTQCQAGMEQSV